MKQSGNQKNMKKHQKKQFPYELTIGMIVKNDVERLRTCLETMEPLRDAIPCQLIITDTGSTDGTRELAEEFADLLLDFTWCDDFSKARNTGVERAEGRWFVFFDSDHEFDASILEVVDFLHSKESHTLDALSVNIRDFMGTMENLKWKTQWKPLFFNFGTKKRYFEGRIHEAIEADSGNINHLPVLVKHWGYLGDLGDGKSDRNLPLLLKSIEDDPMALKNYLQIVNELSSKSEQQKEYILKGIEVAQKRIALGQVDRLEKGILVNLQLQLAKFARRTKDIHLEAETLDKVEGKFSGTVLELEYLGLRLARLLDEKNFEDMLPYFQRFQALYLALQEKPDIRYVNTGTFTCTAETFYPTLEYNLLVFAIENGKESQVLDILCHCFGYTHENHLGEHIFLKQYMAVGKHFRNVAFLLKMYRYIMEQGQGNEKKEMETFIGHCFLEYQGESYHQLLHGFSQEDPTPLLAPYIYEARGCSLEACPEVAVFFQDHPQLFTLHYKILLMDYLKTGNDRFSYIKRGDFSLLLQQFGVYWKQSRKPQQLMYDLFSGGNLHCQTWKEKKLCGYLGLQALLYLCGADVQEIPEMTGLYQKASEILEEYNQGMYQESILEVTESDVIPNLELFAHHSHQAWLAEGDDVAFVTSMKSAMLAHREYQQVVTFFLNVMKEKRHGEIVAKQESRKASLPQEQSELSLKVKKTLGQLILAGKKDEAKMILEKYKKINPHDPDLPLLERTCGAI